MTWLAGIDVGGTKCLGVVVDPSGAVRSRVRISTPKGASELLDALAGLARELEPFDSLGVGVPGLVTRDGVLLAAPNLTGVRHLLVEAELEARLGHPVAVDNDATCAAVAEWRAGAGRGSHDLVVVTLGTGIGGGIVAGGRMQRGHHGFAGEIGHMVVQADGDPCVCGRRGCWERYASGSALGRLDPGRSGEELVAAARAGDPSAIALVERFAWWVALGLVNLTNTTDPELLVIGGGLAGAADVLEAPVQQAFDALLYSADDRPRPRVRFASLGEDAGAIGAAFVGVGN